jgi:quercetin dioxygenase-like cupin family protein
MRQLITGVDGEGRSCVVAEHEVRPRTDDRSHRMINFSTSTNPAPPRPPGFGELRDLEVPVGTTRLMLLQWPPGVAFGMHHTDTIDIDTVLEGSVTLTLDDGPHVLEAGDVVVITGVDHAWESGPEGSTISFVFLGTPSPDA